MKIAGHFSLLLGIIVWPSVLLADNFPDGFIKRQIDSAGKRVEVHLSRLEPGQLMAIEYVDMPVWIYRRTAEDIDYLSHSDKSALADPKNENSIPSIRAFFGSSASYVWARLLLADQPAIDKTPYRSLNEELFVVAGWSPHSGCNLHFKPEKYCDNRGAIFYDSCTGACFDAAGRIYKGILAGRALGSMAEYNMYIPPHGFKNDNTLLVGLAESEKLPEIDVPTYPTYLHITPTEKLIYAARYNDLEAVNSAISLGADVNFYKPGKGSPLDAAIVGSSTEIVELLIEKGAKPTPNSLKAAKLVNRQDVIELIEGIAH